MYSVKRMITRRITDR